MKGMRQDLKLGEKKFTRYRWLPYNSASGQKSLQRQYPGYDPLLIKDLTVSIFKGMHAPLANILKSVNIRCNNPGSLGTGVTGTVAAGQKLTAHWKQCKHALVHVIHPRYSDMLSQGRIGQQLSWSTWPSVPAPATASMGLAKSGSRLITKDWSRGLRTLANGPATPF
tara:strand:- start:1383 stop:1886 length:504 start_codon:yes stop_codon:yes gene_type:complete